MTKMATMPIYGKNHLKIPERTGRRMNLEFACSIENKSPTKIAQMMILGWPKQNRQDILNDV